MHRHSDTNPHFVRPVQPQNQDQLPHTSPRGPFVVPPPLHPGQHPEPLRLSPGWPEPIHPETRQDYEPAKRPHKKHQGRRARPVGQLVSFHPQFEEQKHPQAKHQEIQDRPTQSLVPTVRTPLHDHEQPQHPRPHGASPEEPPPHSQRPGPHTLLMPHPQQTNLFTWSAAICCAIFWVVIIITGLVVLIIYLVFRPKTPKFDVTAATLNAAYLDMGYLLNADLTVLANFTNPNKKVSVDFTNLMIDLYYGTTHIATQYIEPFSAQKSESMFANVHMVISQVRLGVLESQRLTRQLELNRAAFQVKGYFRARANFGKILRYSYWLHGDCRVVFSKPPDGVLVSRQCKTKRSFFFSFMLA